MHWISHRGNLDGPNPERENHLDYIQEALDAGFEVEVDVWFKDNQFYLGHDGPQYPVSNEWDLIRNNRNLWCHAKNIGALVEMCKLNENIVDPDQHFNYFWHENDAVTLTSRGFFWTFPGQQLTQYSICVMPKTILPVWGRAAGVCSDIISKLKTK